MIPTWILVLGIIVVALGVAYGVRNQINGMLGFGGPVALGGVGGKPTIWWFVDDSQVNARQWLDWGERSTREPNEPYLKLCLEKARAAWGQDFVVEPIIGRVAALRRLEEGRAALPSEFKGPAEEGLKIPLEADRCPPDLWMPWCRATFLATFGGLWMDGSVLPMGSGSDLRSRIVGADALTFGSDPDEGLSAAEETMPAAGRSAGWAAVPMHPVWAGMAKDLTALISEGDQSWGAPEARRALRRLWDRHCSGVVRVDRKAEVSRDRYGRRLELDTLLGGTEWVDGSLDGGLWVPLPDGRHELERATHWNWFCRLSEDQIRESDFVWARWATKV
jgi:hypothetical protein